MSLAPAPDAPIAAGTNEQHAREPAARARSSAYKPADAPLAPERLSLSSLDDRLVEKLAARPDTGDLERKVAALQEEMNKMRADLKSSDNKGVFLEALLFYYAVYVITLFISVSV